MQIDPIQSPVDERRRIEQMIKTYSRMLYKVCFTILCNSYDAEDALQETFLRFLTKGPVTEDKDYEKAWLIRVAINVCKNMRMFNLRHRHISLDECTVLGIQDQYYNILQDIVKLPAKYKIVLMLYYVEGYKTQEISRIIHISPDAVRKRLELGRKKLKLEWGKE